MVVIDIFGGPNSSPRHKNKNNNMQKRNGQSTLEYSLLLAAFIAALILMKGYATRVMSGRLREASNSISQEHYLPGEMESNITTTVTGETTTITQMEKFSDLDDPEKEYQGMVTHVITGPGEVDKPGYDVSRVPEVTTKTGWEKSGSIF